MDPASAPDESLRVRLQAALGPQFEVAAPIGRGGFGVVFAAREPALDRPVAIKVLRPELAAPILRERFRREAASAARLQHPHIIPLFGIGERDDLSWFVMPRITGETLRERLTREGRLPVGEARRLLLEVAAALAAAHEAGILHRDVKPDNILLELPAGRAILTDFGIAKSLDSGGSGITSEGMVVGTPEYMSPEQAGGETVIGPQSDLFSLGVVAYQMLTGSLPFEGTTPGAVLLQQLRHPAPPVKRGRPECPDHMAVVVDRCLAVEPGERWQDAAELIAALGRPSAALGPATVAAAPRDDARRFRRGLTGLGAALAVAVAIDVARGVPLLAPVALLLAAGIVASWYGTLWSRGHSWRSLLRPAPPRVAAPSRPGPRTPADQARSDRAAILKRLTALPRSERLRVAALPPALDGAIAALERAGPGGPDDEGPALAAAIARLRTALDRGAGFDAPEVRSALDQLRRLAP